MQPHIPHIPNPILFWKYYVVILKHAFLYGTLNYTFGWQIMLILIFLDAPPSKISLDHHFHINIQTRFKLQLCHVVRNVYIYIVIIKQAFIYRD